jgi:hypothetical protein
MIPALLDEPRVGELQEFELRYTRLQREIERIERLERRKMRRGNARLNDVLVSLLNLQADEIAQIGNRICGVVR